MQIAVLFRYFISYQIVSLTLFSNCHRESTSSTDFVFFFIFRIDRFVEHEKIVATLLYISN